MDKQPVDFIDSNTGELHQGYIAWHPEKPKSRPQRAFVMAFQDAFEILATDKEITLQAQRVFMYLFSQLDFDNYIHVKQKDVGEKLNISPSNMSRAMAILRRKNIILESPYKEVKCYRLNEFIGWKGSIANLEQERKLRLVKSDNSQSTS